MKPSKRIFNYLILMIALVLLSSFDNNNSKLSDQLTRKIQSGNRETKNLVWIFFRDKGPDAERMLSTPQIFLTEKSIQRRYKRIKGASIVDLKDIPVYRNYVEEITATGIMIKQKSKWFNGISCYANADELELISSESFVSKIDLVEKYSSRNCGLSEGTQDNNGQSQVLDSNTINYGSSFTQSNLINVPEVHNEGYHGEEILIASFDAGFDNLQHPAFDSIRARGLRTYDFVNGDTIVANGPTRQGDGWHGTVTLSLVCGFKPGFLVSPAFNAKFILAKTENTFVETPLEEDNWIAAAEWADSLGADIITSSLGYKVFDPPYISYTWQDMDGHTSKITRAADIAVGKGIVVIVSSGNSGFNAEHNTLEVPADANNVITVGAVTSGGSRGSYSSVGPTADGRIKPDVMAMGSFNYAARFGAGNTGYTSAYAGTSLACPMVAGVCALILDANQNLSPIQVRDILRSTANNHSSPNNLVGYGIIDAGLAIQKALETIVSLPENYQLLQNYPNPFNPSTNLRFNLKQSANISLVIFDALGREIDRPVNNAFYNSGYSQINYNNPLLSSGVYYYSMFVDGQLIDSKKMVLIH